MLRRTKCPPKMGPCHRKLEQKRDVSHGAKNTVKEHEANPGKEEMS